MGMGPFPGPGARELLSEQEYGLGSTESWPAAYPVPTSISHVFCSPVAPILVFTHDLLALTPCKPPSDRHSYMQGSLPAHIWLRSAYSEYTDVFTKPIHFSASCFYQDSRVRKRHADEVHRMIPNVYQLCLLSC